MMPKNKCGILVTSRIESSVVRNKKGAPSIEEAPFSVRYIVYKSYATCAL